MGYTSFSYKTLLLAVYPIINNTIANRKFCKYKKLKDEQKTRIDWSLLYPVVLTSIELKLRKIANDNEPTC
jgi:hypothetical protein